MEIMDSLKREVAAVFRTVITGDRDQIEQAINNYREPGYSDCRYYLYKKKDSDGCNLLHYACMYNTDEVATWMLSLTDDNQYSRAPIPKISDNFGATAVMYAASTGKFTFLKAWSKQVSNVKNIDKEGRNILNYFCGSGQTIPEMDNQAARLLLDRDQARLAHFLIEKGFSFYAADPDGMIPFKIYTETNFNKCLYLNQSDADGAQKSWKEVYETINVIKTGKLHSPTLPEPSSLKIYGGLMHTAVAFCFMYHVTTGIKQRSENFEEKITFGKLDVNETDGDGMTALHHLCYYEYDSEPYGLREVLVAKLLELGADPNLKDIRGYTPLMCALERKYIVLYDHSDPRRSNDQGMGSLLNVYTDNAELGYDINKMSYKKISENLERFKERQEELNENFTRHLKNSNDELKKINSELQEQLNERNKHLQDVENILKNQQEDINSLKLKLKDLETQYGPNSKTNETPTSSLLIGNVPLPDVCRHLETDVEVTCLPDASLEDLQAAISKDEQKYKDIYLITGNKLGASDIDLVLQYKDLINATRNKATNVIVSSVLPSVENEDFNDKIQHLNKALEAFCDEAGLVFINNDFTFKYMNGTINEDCFDDEGADLSELGIKKLLKNLGLLTVKKKTQATNI